MQPATPAVAGEEVAPRRLNEESRQARLTKSSNRVATETLERTKRQPDKKELPQPGEH